MSGFISKHLSLIGSNVNSFVPEFSAETLHETSLLATLQELFGWSVIFGVAVLIAIAGSRFKERIRKPIPTLMALYKMALRKA
jgi:hypothetical protein